jgi:AraC-like DNA-binding protein
MLRWFKQSMQLTRVYTGPVPASGRRGVFSPSHFTVWHLQSGGFEMEVGGKAFRLAAPQWFLLPPIPRRQRALPDTRLFSVHFKMDASAIARLDWPAILPVEREDALADLELAAGNLLDSVHAAGVGPGMAFLPEIPVDLAHFLSVQANFLAFFAQLIEGIDPALLSIRERPIDSRVLEARRHLQNTSLDAASDLEAKAAMQGLSFRHLNRLHKEAYGKTFQQYSDELRLDSARAGLATASLTIKEVAHSLGFTDLSAFSNWFRKNELCSPREFRKRLEATRGGG